MHVCVTCTVCTCHDNVLIALGAVASSSLCHNLQNVHFSTRQIGDATSGV